MNLKTLGDFKKENDKGENKDGKKTESYTGGESSGMAVINPHVEKILKKAENTSKSYEDYNKEEKEKGGNVCKITFYSNGFKIDDGEFNDFNDPENKDFMKDLNDGKIPPALQQKYPTGGLSVSLDDRSKETFTPPPPPSYVAFSGSGTSLGGETKAPITSTKKQGASENFLVSVDKNKPTGTLRVRLINGTNVTVEVNMDTTVEDIHRHIETVSGTGNFELYGGFPPKQLDHQVTVEQGDLADSTLTQRQ